MTPVNASEIAPSASFPIDTVAVSELVDHRQRRIRGHREADAALSQNQT